MFLIASCISCKTVPETLPHILIRKIMIGSAELTVEIASTVQEKSKGLMGRRVLDENSGMLFIYENEQIPFFWMKNTTIPLSVAFIDKNKKIVQIKNLTPLSKKHVKPNIPVRFGLEVNRGWFKKNNIKVGDKFHFIKKRKTKKKEVPKVH